MQLEKNRHLDYKARYYLAIKIELHVSKKVLHEKSSKETWTILVKSYQRVADTKTEKLQEFKSQFELAYMRLTESVKECFTRIEDIVNGRFGCKGCPSKSGWCFTEKLFDGIEDEPSNERSKIVHQEKVSNNLPKIEAEIACDLEPEHMIIDIEDTINFVPLFEIACFKEHDEMSIGGITLQPIEWQIGVEWLYKSNCKATGEVDDFKVKENYIDDILKGFTMSKDKLYMSNIQDKLKLTKDGTRDFVDATYFRKLMKSLRYLTSIRLDVIHGTLKFEDLGLREAVEN
ncbi:uncharacterized protein [Nicotiana tomentosiformis]|uniref:uncharacterized protein n=1 Tax=Nicotiana tomentosiformis TaxID=4098 RepID=UPI00388CDBC0